MWVNAESASGIIARHPARQRQSATVQREGDGHLARSDRKPLRCRLGEQGHDLASEAAQALAASLPATGAAAVDQHVTDPRFAQPLEPLGYLVGRSVDCADLVDRPRIAGGP